MYSIDLCALPMLRSNGVIDQFITHEIVFLRFVMYHELTVTVVDESVKSKTSTLESEQKQ